MYRPYEPFVIRRMAEGRIFFVNGQMPFEGFLDCFQEEHPFFMVWQLDDGRIGIMPNATIIPPASVRAGFAPEGLLPSEVEYVTLNNCPYPVIITAHPLAKVDVWLRNFERFVTGFARQTLATFVTSFFDFTPLKIQRESTIRTPARKAEAASAQEI